MNTHGAKADSGKLELSLVPSQIIRDIATVRMYGVEKYGDPDNWKHVEMVRYINALYRHFLAFVDDPNSVDDESGIPHYKHMACNIAFLCEMLKKKQVVEEKLALFQEKIEKLQSWDKNTIEPILMVEGDGE